MTNIIFADLIGMEVFAGNARVRSVIKDVMETGANEVYIIDSDKHGEVLVPAIRQCILDVDVENKENADPPHGRADLRNMYLKRRQAE